MASRRPVELIPGEAIERQQIGHFESDMISDAEINRRYEESEIRIVTEQARYPLVAVPDLLRNESYILNPEFQRRHRWSNLQRSRLIESFIMNVPIPPIFLYESSYSQFEVIDGLQRLTAIKDFYEERYALESLEEWTDLNGRFYSSLPRQIRKDIDRRYLSSIILLQGTAKAKTEAQRLKQIVFERINSGGASLSPQESRSAIYDGLMNKLCIRLSRNATFCEAWDIPESYEKAINNAFYKTMFDVELVLRFFANRQRHHRRDQANFKLFLDYYLQNANKFPTYILRELEDIFTRTINVIVELFGEKAFWLFRNKDAHWSWLGRPTITVYEPMTFVISQMLNQEKSLIRKKQDLRERITFFYKENYAIFEGRGSSPSILRAREDAFFEFFASFL